MKRRIPIIFSALLLPMAILALTPTQAAQAAKPPSPALTWSPPGTYDFGTLTSGTKSAEFTLSYSGHGPSGDVKVTVSGSGFSIPENANGCAGKSLRSGDSCTVSVQYAFTTAGQDNNGTLSATAKKLSATAQLTGKSASTGPNLTISPGVSTGKSGAANTYEWYWGTGRYEGNNCVDAVVYGPGYDECFTMTNEGDSPVYITSTEREITSTDAGTFGGYTTGYMWCVGATLNPGDSCTFATTQAQGDCVTSPTPGTYSRIVYRQFGRSPDNPDAVPTEYLTLTVYGQWICGWPNPVP